MKQTQVPWKAIFSDVSYLLYEIKLREMGEKQRHTNKIILNTEALNTYLDNIRMDNVHYI
jgi:hypothetical protein